MDEKSLQSMANSSESRTQRKRRHSEFDEQLNTSCVPAPKNGVVADYIPSTKIRGIDSSNKFSLTEFPDELLYEIFKNLDSWSYFLLMNCCSRFCSLLMDRRFWQHIDLSEQILPLGILEDVMERTHKGTTCLKLRGPPREYLSTEIKKFNKTLADSFALRCTQLSILELRGVTVDLGNVRIVHFPQTLKRLVLTECNICKLPQEQTIFCGIHTHLVHLEELGIEFSNWFEPYYIMMISKIPSLRWLSLKGSPRLGDFIPYGSMAARFGFKKLEYLDLRFTPVSDSDVQCFNVVPTLKELLLDCPLNLRGNETKPNSETNAERKDTDAYDCQPSTSKASSSLAELNTFLNSNSEEDSPNTSTQEAQQSTDDEQPSCSSPQLSSGSSSSSCSACSPPASPPLPICNLPSIGGNLPSRSRFLPRPDQVILLEFLSRRPHIRHVRPPVIDNHFDQMMQHPLFWNIINPLGRGSESNCSSSLAGSVPHFNHHSCFRPCPISDRAICCFGRPQDPVEHGIIWIRIGNRPAENSFVRLSVRNYKKVTDISLEHLVQCSPELIYLDLSGTSVTREGVQRFKARKPDCQIITDHLVEDADCPGQDLTSD
ncbi:uncharacterized protein LOC129236450 [Anastrepha obliqua]|uniref:uncharacterized protein LOC129236450 n=1 Tax=Anastrepha obliqua TaxID=95512 RepID=UPI002409A510|nr:uncharacterized protein LOC129236450 [Anastrepha obliqua]